MTKTSRISIASFAAIGVAVCAAFCSSFAGEETDRLPVVVVDAIDGVTGASVPGVKWRLRAEGGTWIAGADAPRLVVERGSSNQIDVEVDAPEGRGAFGPLCWKAHVASRTRRARIEVVLYPLRDVRFQLEDREARPVVGATTIEAWDWAPFGHGVSWRPGRAVAADRDGLLVVAMPRVPFGRPVVRVEGSDDGGRLFGEAENVPLDAPDDVPPTKIVLCRDRSVGGGSSCGTRAPPPDRPTAPLVVQVAYRDGEPAEAVEVHAGGVSGLTDSAGNVELKAVPIGRCDVVAGAHGFLPAVVAADVGVDRRISIRESAPRKVRMIVVDESGAPRPGALVSVVTRRIPGVVSKELRFEESIAQLVGGEERLNPKSGEGGEIELVSTAGTMWYRAELGDAWGGVESSDDVVKVVLVRP